MEATARTLQSNRPVLVAGTPAVWHYRAWFVVADVEVGKPSAITVTMRP